MKKALFYSAALIGTYLLVSHATDAGKLITSGGSAASQFAKTLQGR
jgi:hypothetical protein